jgi:hypothetical protein
MRPALGVLAMLGLGLPGRAAAQSHQHGPIEISPAAMEQIRAVGQAIGRFGDTQTAQAAGFGPVFGWIPTMGTHWVSPARMMSGKRFESSEPPQLLFSSIGGKSRLVGAAYAYIAAEGDSTRPASFDGNPPWHEHPDLAPPGMTLVMLHVWFVDSPDGPFAGHNPWLPFWALGLVPPNPDRLQDSDDSRRIRAAALALGEVVDSAGVFPRLAQRTGVQQALAPHRTAIRGLIPALDRSQKSGDWSDWNRIADRLAVHWGDMRQIYLAAIQRADFRERVEKFLVEMETGGH